MVIFPYALGDKDKTMVQLRIHPNNSGGNSLKKEYCRENIKEQQVIMRTLDSTTTSLCDSTNRISLIKIDIQGSEQEEIIGGLKTIKRHKPIILCEGETKNGIGNKIKTTLSQARYNKFIKFGKDTVFMHQEGKAPKVLPKNI